MLYSGTITRQEFEQGCQTIIDVFDEALDVEWVEETNSIVAESAARGYVRAVNDARFRRSNAAADDASCAFARVQTAAGDEDIDKFEDAMALATSAARCDHIREYRVVYSPTFRVPVMCLRARDASTREPWTISRLLAEIRTETRTSDVSCDERDPVLTPYENPHERREGAWACVHPCSTSEVMRLLLSHSHHGASNDHGDADIARYFALWIRFVAREIGLDLSPHATVR